MLLRNMFDCCMTPVSPAAVKSWKVQLLYGQHIKMQKDHHSQPVLECIFFLHAPPTLSLSLSAAKIYQATALIRWL
jgi:hypothetical protein